MSSEITIVIPSYNHEKYVAQALQSAAAIRCSDRPHLFLVDDGSTDGTYAIAEETMSSIRSSFASVRLKRRANSGLSSTLNFALEQIETKYMLAIASDDIFCENIVETLLPPLSNPNVALAVGDNIFIDGSSNQLKRTNNGREFEKFIDFHVTDKTGFTREQFGKYQSFLTGNYIASGWLIDVEKIRSIGGWNQTFILEDWEILCRISKRFEIAVVDSVTAKYRVHSSNTSSKRENELLFDAIRIYINEYLPAKDSGFLNEWMIGVRNFRNLLFLKPEFAKLFFARIRNYHDVDGCHVLLSVMTGRLDKLMPARDMEKALRKLQLQLFEDAVDPSRGCSVEQALASLPEFLNIEHLMADPELNEERKRGLSIVRSWLYSAPQFYKLFSERIHEFSSHPEFSSYISSLAGVPSGSPLSWGVLRMRILVVGQMRRLLPLRLKKILRFGMGYAFRFRENFRMKRAPMTNGRRP